MTAAIRTYRNGGSITSGDQLAWLALTLALLPVRDAAWLRMDPACRDAHQRLWTTLTRLAPPKHVTAPATLLAFTATGTGLKAAPSPWPLIKETQPPIQKARFHMSHPSLQLPDFQRVHLERLKLAADVILGEAPDLPAALEAELTIYRERVESALLKPITTAVAP